MQILQEKNLFYIYNNARKQIYLRIRSDDIECVWIFQKNHFHQQGL
jgi:hypothetical protein